ncbi:MAG: electron transfer flavoprotein subunit beta/FixA family protein [Gammaproteobacteria bacterium]|nr:electron transfer flavoprotein subunit beta/FixA family protein [Gammaproteobacteria bacterium]MCY4218334.1 electron transfer flavoprotein subunit beta/FixA family protein [Gammaproteobacteria bacterium]MCY4274034.1 electron transfer flavoprotein subunit beta/FixA family protein [Gammaproteobacteria bacterium]
MKILVPVKRVIDANIRVRVKDDHSGVETANIKMAINPFCEIAVEEALRLKEKGSAEEIIIVSVGPAKCIETIRNGLAMGANRGIHVLCDNSPEPLALAKILKMIVERESVGLVLLGKQSIDDDNNQTGQMLAALLGWPLGSYISSIAVNDKGFEIVREIDSGLERLQLTAPAIMTADLRLNEPRYASLPNIMQAKKKPIEELTPIDLGIDITPRVQTIEVHEPPAREAGIMVSGASELVDKLKNEAKVI